MPVDRVHVHANSDRLSGSTVAVPPYSLELFIRIIFFYHNKIALTDFSAAETKNKTPTACSFNLLLVYSTYSS
jgi:hypothetical protein